MYAWHLLKKVYTDSSELCVEVQPTPEAVLYSWTDDFSSSFSFDPSIIILKRGQRISCARISFGSIVCVSVQLFLTISSISEWVLEWKHSWVLSKDKPVSWTSDWRGQRLPYTPPGIFLIRTPVRIRCVMFGCTLTDVGSLHFKLNASFLMNTGVNLSSLYAGKSSSSGTSMVIPVTLSENSIFFLMDRIQLFRRVYWWAKNCILMIKSVYVM